VIPTAEQPNHIARRVSVAHPARKTCRLRGINSAIFGHFVSAKLLRTE